MGRCSCDGVGGCTNGVGGSSIGGCRSSGVWMVVVVTVVASILQSWAAL